MPTYRDENLNVQAQAFLPIAMAVIRNFFECLDTQDEESFTVRHNSCYNGRERGYCVQVAREHGFVKEQMQGITGVRFFFAEERGSDRFFIQSWGVTHTETYDDLLDRAQDGRGERAYRTRVSFSEYDYRDAAKHFYDKLEEYLAPLANAEEPAPEYARS